MKSMDLNDDGAISKHEFVVWYTKSEERIKNKTMEVFKKFDKVSFSLSPTSATAHDSPP